MAAIGVALAYRAEAGSPTIRTSEMRLVGNAPTTPNASAGFAIKGGILVPPIEVLLAA